MGPELNPAGFEPALPKETDLKSVALDHSAIDPECCRDTICLNFNNTDEFAVDVSKRASCGARTRGPEIKSLMLYRLS